MTYQESDMGMVKGGEIAQRVVAVTDDAVLCEGLTRIAGRATSTKLDILSGAALPDLAEEMDRRTDLILLDLERTDDPVAAVSNVTSNGRVRVVAFGNENDVSLYRSLQSAGVADYFVKPVYDDLLERAVRLPENCSPTHGLEHQSSPSQTVNLIIGARGGTGASSLAVSVGWWIAERLKQQVGLVDLDLSFGTTALALDILPGRGLRDALENPARIDPLFVGSAMVSAGDNLFLLAAEEPLREPIAMETAALSALLDALKENFPNLVFDVPRDVLPQTVALIESAEAVSIVTELTLAGLRDAIRVRDFVRDHGAGVDIVTIALKPEVGAPAVSRREFERGYERSLDWVLPRTAKKYATAASDGVPLVARLGRRHGYTKCVNELASRFVLASETKKGGRWSWPW